MANAALEIETKKDWWQKIWDRFTSFTSFFIPWKKYSKNDARFFRKPRIGETFQVIKKPTRTKKKRQKDIECKCEQSADQNWDYIPMY